MQGEGTTREAVGLPAAAASLPSIPLTSANTAVASSPRSDIFPTSTLASNSRTADRIASLEQVLARNESYHDFLESQLKEIQRLLDINAEKRRLVEQIEERTRLQSLQINAQNENGGGKSSLAAKLLPIGMNGLNIPRKAIFSAPFFIDANANVS